MSNNFELDREYICGQCGHIHTPGQVTGNSSEINFCCVTCGYQVRIILDEKKADRDTTGPEAKHSGPSKATKKKAT